MVKINLLTKRLIGVIVISIFLFLVPQITFSQELSKEYKKILKNGKKHIKSKEYKLAIDCFLDVYYESPKNEDNLYLLTTVYYNDLGDYPNAYKYGKELFTILKNDIKDLDSEDDKKEIIRKKDLLDEIDLIVYFAKERSGISEANESDDVGESAEEEPSDTEVNESDEIEEGTSEEIDEYQNDNSIIVVNNNIETSSPTNKNQSIKLITAPFVGIAILDSENSKSEIVEKVSANYEKIKSKPNRKFNDIISENAELQDKINQYEEQFYSQFFLEEQKLIVAIHKYNMALFYSDSVNQIVNTLIKRDSLFSDEALSLTRNKQQLSKKEQSLLSNKSDTSYQQKVFIGQCEIQNCTDKNNIKKIINEIISIVENNTKFCDPKSNASISFVNSINDIKYLNVVIKVASSNCEKRETGFNQEMNNLKVFEYNTDCFINIINNEKISIDDFTFNSNEMEILNVMEQSIHNSVQNESIVTSIDLIDSLQINIDKQINLIINKSTINQAKIDSIIEMNNNYLSTQEEIYNQQKAIYDSLISNVKFFSNYLIVNEGGSNTAKGQYKEMASDIVDIVFDKYKDDYLRLDLIKPYIDSTNSIIQIKYSQNSVSLQPVISQYEIVSQSKIGFGDSDSTHFAIELGFVVDYLLQDSIDNTMKAEFVSERELVKEKDKTVATKESLLPIGEYSISEKDSSFVLIDPDNRRWKSLEDNPSSYTSYLMFQKEEGWKLPTYQALKDIINYLKTNSPEAQKLDWLKDGVVYLSSDIELDKRHNERHKAIRYSKSSCSDISVESGDEVYLIVIKELQ